MKIIFINLHKISFLLRNQNQINANWKINIQKHGFLMDYLISNNVEIVNIIVCKDEERENQRKEAERIYTINGYNLDSIRTIFEEDIDVIKPDDVMIVYYHYFTSFINAKRFNCRKILMGNHFIRVRKEQYFNLKDEGYEVFANEVDVKENEFVNHFFNLKDVDTIIFPYAFGQRFVQKKDWNERKNKVMAVGTCAPVFELDEYSGFSSFYGSYWAQPMRYEIFKKKRRLRKYIDSYISYRWEGNLLIKKKDWKFIKKFKKWYNEHHELQGKYASFDMVEKFNDYKMFVCPEERQGVIGIGTIEGMACGTAYIGIEHPMYQSLGLIPGVHYISYDGTLHDMKAKIKYYQNHNEELYRIAKNGTEYVRKNFNTDKVATDFFQKLVQMSEATK